MSGGLVGATEFMKPICLDCGLRLFPNYKVGVFVCVGCFREIPAFTAYDLILIGYRPDKPVLS
jgi:hypothetical protein